MHKIYLIHHGDPYAAFAGWCPFKLSSWHTHPLSNGDCIVTATLTTLGVQDELEAMEANGDLTLFPTLQSGNTMPAKIHQHKAMIAAGILPTHRTWDAAKMLQSKLGWPPLHPDR